MPDPAVNTTVNYVVSAADVAAIELRRVHQVRPALSPEPAPDWTAGETPADRKTPSAGDVLPMLVIGVEGESVNGRVWLDRDSLWVVGAARDHGKTPGTWHE